ncbi:MAG: hypothetical protein EBV06_15920, partial [Planctomycetia bacterium]|nr:hypothetical protein [Planctomycetia bacterium]
ATIDSDADASGQIAPVVVTAGQALTHLDAGILATSGWIQDQVNIEGETVDLDASKPTATSSASYSALGLPLGVSIDTTTGLITGTLSVHTNNQAVTVIVLVSEGTSLASSTFTWRIASRITISPVPDQHHMEGDVVSLEMSATNPYSANLTFTAIGLPSGLTIDDNTGEISGTILPQASTYEDLLVTTVIVTDGIFTNSTAIWWTISSRITIAPISPQQSVEGEPVSIQVSAVSPDSSPLTYAATGLPNGLSIDSATGLISGTLEPNTSTHSGGPLTVHVSVTDGTYTTVRAFAWDIAGRLVLDLIPDQSNTQGDQIALTINATSIDNESITFSATGLPAGLMIDGATGEISGTLVPSSSASGEAALVVVTANQGVYSSTSRFFWTVRSPIVVAFISNQFAIEGAIVSLPVQASGPGNAWSYQATGLPSGLSIDSTTGLIEGTIAAGTASQAGYQVEIVATNGDYTGRQWFVWVVNDRYIIEDVPNRQTAEGDTVTLAVVPTNAGGVTLSFFATGLPAGLSIDAANGLITGTIAANTATNGLPLHVVVTVSDGIYSATESFQWIVNEQTTQSELTTIGESFEVEEGQTITGGDIGGYPRLLENDQDSTGLPLTISAVNGLTSNLGQTVLLPSGGQVTVSADGSFNLVAAIGFAGVESFSYTVTNGVLSAIVTAFVTTTPAPAGVFLDKVLLENLGAADWGGAARKLTAVDINKLFEKFELDPNFTKIAAIATLKMFIIQKGEQPGVLGDYADTFGTVDLAVGLTEENIKTFAANRALSATHPDPAKRALGVKARLVNDYFRYLITEATAIGPPVIADTAGGKYLIDKTLSNEALAKTIRQGIIGDCAFLAALINFTRKEGAVEIGKRIKLTATAGDGRKTFEVIMFGTDGKAKTLTIEEPTIAQRLVYGRATDRALWVTLMELASLKQRIADGNLLVDVRLVNGSYYEQAAGGEYMQDAIKRLTGTITAERRVIEDLVNKSLLDQVRHQSTSPRVLSAASKDTLPAFASMLGIVKNHAYSVVGYRDNKIILRNPHNRSDMAGGEESQLTLEDFRACFVDRAMTSFLYTP